MVSLSFCFSASAAAGHSKGSHSASLALHLVTRRIVALRCLSLSVKHCADGPLDSSKESKDLKATPKGSRRRGDTATTAFEEWLLKNPLPVRRATSWDPPLDDGTWRHGLSGDDEPFSVASTAGRTNVGITGEIQKPKDEVALQSSPNVVPDSPQSLSLRGPPLPGHTCSPFIGSAGEAEVCPPCIGANPGLRIASSAVNTHPALPVTTWKAKFSWRQSSSLLRLLLEGADLLWDPQANSYQEAWALRSRDALWQRRRAVQALLLPRDSRVGRTPSFGEGDHDAGEEPGAAAATDSWEGMPGRWFFSPPLMLLPASPPASASQYRQALEGDGSNTKYWQGRVRVPGDMETNTHVLRNRGGIPTAPHDAAGWAADGAALEGWERNVCSGRRGGNATGSQVISAYTVRAKQGKSQLRHLREGGSGGRMSAGGAIRAEQTRHLFSSVNSKLAEWSDLIGRCGWLFFSGDVCAWNEVYACGRPRLPVDRHDPRWHRLPFHVNLPRQRELQRVMFLIGHGTVGFQVYQTKEHEGLSPSTKTRLQ